MIVNVFMFYFIFLHCTATKLNFVLILIDDLRPSLGCYGDNNAYTPNIDNLAKDSAIFSKAYAQQALCAPSRNSLLTSRRPDTLKLYDFYSYWRIVAGNYTTLPQYMKNNGYFTKSIGKIFHPGISSNGSDDSPYSWSEKPFHPYTNIYKNDPVCSSKGKAQLESNLVCPVHVRSMPNATLPDIEIANEAKKFIIKHAHKNKFFLAVGFQKPHIPLKYPQYYLKFHPVKKFKLPEPYKWPNNISDVAYNPWIDLRKRDDVKTLKLKFPWQKIPKNFSKSIIQSYYAAISYIDKMVGSLINQLIQSNIRDETVIILTSDHGWSLGEHAAWGKYSNFDVALRVPLIVSIPNVTYKIQKYKNNVNQMKNKDESINRNCLTTNVLVELVDIFPTITDLAKIPIPICPEVPHENAFNFSTKYILPNPCSEGISFLPVIKSLIECQNISWKSGVISQYPRPNLKPTIQPNSDEPRSNEITIMGYSLKTERYRYTAWIEFTLSSGGNWSHIVAEELYNHKVDEAEVNNLVVFPEFSNIKQRLNIKLKLGWRHMFPKKNFVLPNCNIKS